MAADRSVDKDKFIDLAAWKEENTPHLSGKALCLACRHEWAAVAPVGTVWLECPSCTLSRGRFVNAVEREGAHWHCACGNDLFYATPDGFYCPNCGVWQKGF